MIELRRKKTKFNQTKIVGSIYATFLGLVINPWRGGGGGSV